MPRRPARRLMPVAIVMSALLLPAGCGGGGGTVARQTSARAVPALAAPSASPTYSPAATSASPLSAPRPTVRTETLRSSSTAPVYTVALEYPRLTGLAAAGVETAINADLRAAAVRIADAFVADVERASGSWTPPPGTPPAGLEGRYDTVHLDARLASFRLAYAPYAAGAAHPSDLVETFTYDLRTGHRYRLAELFRPGTAYLAVLSRESRQLLLAQHPDLDAEEVAGGTKPTADNFAAWTVTDDGLQVTFGDYQVGPHALGTPSVTIPMAALRPIAAPDGPLLVR